MGSGAMSLGKLFQSVSMLDKTDKRLVFWAGGCWVKEWTGQVRSSACRLLLRCFMLTVGGGAMTEFYRNFRFLYSNNYT